MVKRNSLINVWDCLKKSGLGENAVCEVTWVFEDVAEGG